MTISILIIGLVILVLLGVALAVKVIKQYEQGVLFRLGRVLGAREPGLRVIIPFVDVLHRVSLRIITMPIQSQGIITRDNVSVDVSAVAYFRVVDAVKSVVAIEMCMPLSTRSPRPRCGRSSGNTPLMRRCPKPTVSTWISAKSSTSIPSSGVWKWPWWN
jgi:regulator of protease activity HflC (stomatin/prohibitin superfamily)